MRNNLLAAGILVGAISSSGLTYAADQSLEKLSSVQTEIMLLKAENEKEELIQKLKKLREVPEKVEEKAAQAAPAMAGPPVPPPSAFTMQPPPLPGPATAPKYEKPTLKLVERPEVPILRGVVGAGSKLFATVAFDSGEEIEATVGDLLPGGLVVTSVSMNKVMLKDKNGRSIAVIRSAGATLKPQAPLAIPSPEKSYMLSDQPGRSLSILGGPQ